MLKQKSGTRFALAFSCMVAVPTFMGVAPALAGNPVSLSSLELDQVTAGSITSHAGAASVGLGGNPRALTSTKTQAVQGKWFSYGTAGAKAYGSGADAAGATAGILVSSDSVWASGVGTAEAPNGGKTLVKVTGGVIDTKRADIAYTTVISISYGADSVATASASSGSYDGTGTTRTFDRTITKPWGTIAISRTVTVTH